MGANNKSFIEVQFPVSKVSKESYKERKAASGQTLTGLGKWWGRKPLTLVRAAIIGLLLPSSSDPIKDRELFLKILTMDNDGLWARKNEQIPIGIIWDNSTVSERKNYFGDGENASKLQYKKSITRQEIEDIQRLVFLRLSYDEKLQYCLRAEEVEDLGEDYWNEINRYLNTNALNLRDFVKELSINRFGHIARVGDCFCGGGSIPFEAARIGCEAYASDLNPIASLLTWANLNLLNKSGTDIEQLIAHQSLVFDKVWKQVDEWSIEINEQGWRASFYLYCYEVFCPECGCKVPLSVSWIISQHKRVVALLEYNSGSNAFNILIKSNASDKELEKAEADCTIKKGSMICPKCGTSTPIPALRKDRKRSDGTIEYGLRSWDARDIIPQEDDVFQERLYCIKYFDKFENKSWEQFMKKAAKSTDTSFGNVYFAAPSDNDIERENRVLQILKEKYNDWKEKGYIPNNIIEDGYNTAQLKRERGWSSWHHLFNPRQLLLNGLFFEKMIENANSIDERVIGLLGINKCVDRNSKLCRWHISPKQEKGEDTFYNQALNTIFNYSSRALSSLYPTWAYNINNTEFKSNSFVELNDARNVSSVCDFWITDPPYADAVNYHELSEFFLAWDKKILSDTFKGWYTDSKRTLAVTGRGKEFNESMIDIYSNIERNMAEDGVQIAMFTHQDVNVWAELTMILWSSGLRVTAAWNIATETDASGIKQGNYVKGTVLLVLRKQASQETAYLDELYPEIEEEVKRQIDSMQQLDDKEDPNFSDADYLLAAYAASLKVLTSYKQIEDIDIKYELSKTRTSSEESPIEKIIKEAVKIAYDYLIPTGFDSFTWKMLIPEERFYIKGLDLEKANVYQISAYQELARGFGVKDYKDILGSTKANQARLKTGSEFGLRGMSDNDKFGSSLLRNILASLHQSIKEEDTIAGKNWLKNEVPNYWIHRNTIVEILDYISTLAHIENMPHWEQEATYANMLRERIKDDSI